MQELRGFFCLSVLSSTSFSICFTECVCQLLFYCFHTSLYPTFSLNAYYLAQIMLPSVCDRKSQAHPRAGVGSSCSPTACHIFQYFFTISISFFLNGPSHFMAAFNRQVCIINSTITEFKITQI